MYKPLAHIPTFLFLLALTGATCLGWGSGSAMAAVPAPGGGGKDTVQAVVIYGNQFLFEKMTAYSEADVASYLDSLLSMDDPPETLIMQVKLYLSLRFMDEEGIINMIDSLFEADDIPYALINQINLFIANREEEPPPGPTDGWVFSGEDTSRYPANQFYQRWNTVVSNPYPHSITRGDSTIYLVLQGTEKLGKFHIPVDNVLTSKFGWRNGRNHNGIDIDLEVWDTVRVAFPGMVRVASYQGGYGRLVVVRHHNGLETSYAHLHRLRVKPGQIVEAGDLIGLGGSSGNSTGSHLHFECRFKGIPINPLNFISIKEKALIGDTLVLRKTKYGYAAYPSGVIVHTVTPGDNLYDIAKKYGTTTYRLCELNGIRRNAMLIVGQRIRVI